MVKKEQSTLEIIPPNKEELEIILFGRGYGESILVNFGNFRYAVIDSFLNPSTGNPIALDYLNKINIPFKNIELVVATHWHNDHIKGLSKILTEANSNAKFVTSTIINDEKFNSYIACGNNIDFQESDFAETSEFSKILDMIDNSKIQVVLASHNKNLFTIAKNINFYALSPQDNEVFEYLKQLKMPQINEKKYDFSNDNCISIVVWLELGNNIVLLGGDLLNFQNNNKRGWQAIVDNHTLLGKADLFKVPHHGSVSSHNSEVWDKLLKEKTISILTKFNNKLPKNSDINRIKSKSSIVYVAGNNKKERNKILNKFNITIEKEQVGIIRASKNINDLTGSWNIKCFGKVKTYN